MSKMHIFRVKPKEDLLKGIMKYCEINKIRSGIVVSVIGSLQTAKLGFLKKLPGHYIHKKVRGPMEIVSGQGTIAMMGREVLPHIHIQVSTDKVSLGGHLAHECFVFSTAEVVLLETKSIQREKNSYTGLNELKE